MAVLASDILTRAQVIVQDTTGVRWPLAELLQWLNDGQREAVNIKPSVTATTMVLNLQQGTFQRLGADALALLRAVRNLKTPVTEPRIGTRAVRMVSQDVLDAQDPNWHDPSVFPYTKDAKHFCFDSVDPTAFYVFPGNDGTGALEVVVSKMPADVVATGDPTRIESYRRPVSVPDIYLNPLLDYVLFRAYMKDADLADNAARSTMHYQLFAGALTAKATNEGAVNPTTRGAV